MDIKLTDIKVTRDGMGEALKEIFVANDRAVALSADIGMAFKLDSVREKTPEKYIECGICEQNMIAVAAGMSYEGLIPICGSFAEFLPMRCLDQIRVSVCMNKANVKMIGGHAGLSYGGDGETIQAFEDIAALKSLPNIHIMVPANATEAYEMTKLAFEIDAPVYLRITRELEQNFELENGGSLINSMIKSGEKVAIIGSGPFLYKGYQLAKLLSERLGINPAVFNLSYIKPYPVDYIKGILRDYEKIITLEDHQLRGGIGSIVSEISTEFIPRKILKLGIDDRFGECGIKEELDEELDVDLEKVFEKTKEFLK